MIWIVKLHLFTQSIPSYTGTLACCPHVEVVQAQENMTAVKEARPYIFTEYRIEGTLVNGKPHYTSSDRQTAIAYTNSYGGGWMIQPEVNRY